MKTSEELFQDFLELLDRDSQDQYVGFLFEFIRKVLESTMDLGKNGFAPVMGVTLYAKDTTGKTEIVFHPYMSANIEIYQMLKLGVFSEKLKTAINDYGKEVWGMTPIDERNDIKDQAIAVENFNVNWGHLLKEGEK